MTAVPAVTTFSDAAATSASAVYANDVALAGAFGALDTTNSISNDNSPIMIGPIRATLSAGPVTLYRWTAPVDLELWELHVSPMPAVDGTTAGATLDADNTIGIGVLNGASAVTPYASLDNIAESVVLDLSASGTRFVTTGQDVSIVTSPPAGSGAAPKFHANISILAYTKHRG